MKQAMKQRWEPILGAMVLFAASLVGPRLLAETVPGEDLFNGKCASCHGPDGGGKTPVGAALKIRDLRSEDVQKQSDADLSKTISKGKNKMPAFDGKLKKEQIEQLVGYVRELGKKH
jgi:mono/diheme cytochrome c family protein